MVGSCESGWRHGQVLDATLGQIRTAGLSCGVKHFRLLLRRRVGWGGVGVGRLQARHLRVALDEGGAHVGLVGVMLV